MNIDKIAKKMGIEPEFYLELVGDFLERGVDDLKELDAAIEMGNVDDAVKAAHSIKGAVGSLNLVEIAGIASETEAIARAGRLSELKELVQLLKFKIKAVHELIE